MNHRSHGTPVRPAPLHLLLLGALLLLSPLPSPGAASLRPHPDNPRYLEHGGRPLLIIGSGEHYGALVNPDFDFHRYFATLGREHLNHSRLFTGAAYVEPQGAFNIERNTLAPATGRYLAPWARSSSPGYRGGGTRFDLDHWNEAYFDRLQALVKAAARNSVFVEINLFCPFYEDSQWLLSPFHPDNNINGAGQGVDRTHVYTPDKHGGLLAHQERFVRRVVNELRDADFVYYEICNEPYFAGVSPDWQDHIAQLIADTQRSHRHPKLISRNIANGRQRVEAPLPQIGLYNFHYASPPDAVALNRHLNLPIGDNETGFAGTNNLPYRIEAWDFILAGGALFSHLDYSFTAGFEDGTFAYPASQPGGGNPDLRRQFAFLLQKVQSLPLARLQPLPLSATSTTGTRLSAQALTDPGRVVLAYFHPLPPAKDKTSPAPPKTPVPITAEVRIELPAGRNWTATWIDPASGRSLRQDRQRIPNSTPTTPLTLTSPEFIEDIALHITRR